LAAFPAGGADGDRMRRLLDRGVTRYGDLGAALASSGSEAEVRTAVDSLSRLLPDLPAAARGSLAPSLERLQALLQTAR
jgi:hypothetical protein